MEEITTECWRYFLNVKAQVPLFLLVAERLKEISRYGLTSTFTLHTLEKRKNSKEVNWYYIWYLSKVLEDLDIPEELRDMFISIPEEKFRIDISSTEIRKNHGLWYITYFKADLGWFSTTIEGTNESFHITRAMFNSKDYTCMLVKHSASILDAKRHWMMNQVVLAIFLAEPIVDAFYALYTCT